MTRPLHLVVPGALDQRTGGYLYDARMVEELRRRGRPVVVHELPGRFPDPDPRAREALDAALGALPDGATVVVDGLALGGLPEVATRHGPRLGLVALVHHPLADETGLSDADRLRFRRSEEAALAAAVGVLVTSRFTRRRLADYGLPPERVRSVEPGTEPAPPVPGPGPGAPPRLLCVGTLTPRKGQDLLVRALGRLRDRPWDCVLAGSGERAPAFAEALRRAIRDGGLENRIHLAGELDATALEGVWASASLFVLPSWYEGYGMALAEALVRGLPVVSTTGGAIPDTVPAEAGHLVEPGDVDGLADGLARLLDDPEARAALARAAREHGARLPGWAAQAGTFAAAVDELVGHV